MPRGGSTSTPDSVLIMRTDVEGGGAVRVFGVGSFVLGVVALGYLAVRRGRKAPTKWSDHVALFIGIAGSITGLAVIFMRFND